MKLTGTYTIPASKQTVWDALNDPDALAACIPGCESFDVTGENEFSAQVTAKVGPVKAKFKGTVLLSELDAPNSYRISGEGQGGPAGFAKGGALVQLTDGDDGTLLTYDVDATVGGKLAQIGQRLIDGAAKKLADDFFGAFNERLGGSVEAAGVPDGAEAIAVDPDKGRTAAMILLALIFLACVISQI